jgi:RNA polymerase sigma-70 factor (ECF subfamily)
MQKEAYSQLADFDLIRASPEHRNDAWEEVLTRYYSGILRYLVASLGDYEEAVQLTQDTFLDAFRSADGNAEGLELGPWLFRIARNNLLPYQRRRGKIQFLSLEQDSASVNLGRSLHGGDLFVEHLALSEAVTTVIEQLRPTLREPLILNTLAGFTAADVARIMGIRKETAERRISRAKAEFKRLWKTSWFLILGIVLSAEGAAFPFSTVVFNP